MRVVFFVLNIIAMLIGFAIFAVSKDALHQINGMMFFTAAAILLGSGCIIDLLSSQSKQRDEIGEF